MIEALRGISFVSQKVKISKEVYYELHPNPPNSGIIAFDRFLIKLKAEKNSFYACVISSYVRVKRVCIFEGSEHQILLEFYEGNQKTEKTFPCSILEPKEIKTLLSCGILYDSGYAKTLKKLKDKGILIAEGDRLTRRVKLGATRVVGFCFRFDSSEESSKDKNSTFDS